MVDDISLKSGPLLITEKEANCSASMIPSVRKLREVSEGAFVKVSYSLTDEVGCVLEFTLPKKGSAVDPDYKQVMLYQILIDGRQVYRFG